MYSTEYSFFFSMASLCRLNVIQWPTLTADCSLWLHTKLVRICYLRAITIIFNIWILLHIFAASTDIVVMKKKIDLPHIIAFNRMWFRKYKSDEKCAVGHCRRSVSVSHRIECSQCSMLHARWLEEKLCHFEFRI